MSIMPQLDRYCDLSARLDNVFGGDKERCDFAKSAVARGENSYDAVMAFVLKNTQDLELAEWVRNRWRQSLTPIFGYRYAKGKRDWLAARLSAAKAEGLL